VIIPYNNVSPRVHPEAFVEQSAMVIGDVEMAERSSVWFNAVVRGDVHYIRIGARTNIQDGSVVHVTHNKWPTVIGADCVLGHRVVIHGAVIGDHCLIGIGSIVLDGAEVGGHCIVGAGALVPPGMKVPPRTLVMGVPARPVREINEKDHDMLMNQPLEYLRLIGDYAGRDSKR
jgi:carbonic anhydrase/acetyltransferase-like protein (isoleucine patch superfamily)